MLFHIVTGKIWRQGVKWWWRRRGNVLLISLEKILHHFGRIWRAHSSVFFPKAVSHSRRLPKWCSIFEKWFGGLLVGFLLYKLVSTPCKLFPTLYPLSGHADKYQFSFSEGTCFHAETWRLATLHTLAHSRIEAIFDLGVLWSPMLNKISSRSPRRC